MTADNKPAEINIGQQVPFVTDTRITELVKQFVQYMVPQAPAPETGQDVEKILMRVVSIVEAFCASFVALRKGEEQFGEEMGLRG